MSIELIGSPTKFCTRCGEELPRTEEYFQRRRDRPLGFSSQCKKCIAIRDAKRKRAKCKYGPGERRQHSVPGTQECTRCKVTYPETSEYFGKRKACSNGLASWCRECHREIAREARAKLRASPEGSKIIKEQKMRYAKSEKGVLQKRASSFIHNNKRRQRRTSLPYIWSADAWEATLSKFERRCAYCGKSGGLQQDHFIPLSSKNCPGTIIGNIVPACGPCNLSKGRKMPREWIKDETLAESIEASLSSLASEEKI